MTNVTLNLWFGTFMPRYSENRPIIFLYKKWDNAIELKLHQGVLDMAQHMFNLTKTITYNCSIRELLLI